MVRLSFEVGADDLYLPVSLASMVSKYLRELLMDCMNEYFVGMNAEPETHGGVLEGRSAVCGGVAAASAPPGD